MLPGYVHCIFKSIYYTYLHQHKIYISSNAFVNFDKSLIIQQVVLFFTHYSYFLSLWPNKGNLSIIQVLRYMMKMKLFSWVTFLISSLSNCFEVLNYIQEAFQVINGQNATIWLDSCCILREYFLLILTFNCESKRKEFEFKN